MLFLSSDLFQAYSSYQVNRTATFNLCYDRESSRCIGSRRSTMSRQYKFIHTCGHTGIWPIIRPQITNLATSQDLPTWEINPGREIISLSLNFRCPFCTPDISYLEVSPGSGVLVILESTSTDTFPNTWRVLRTCNAEQIISRDWDPVQEQGEHYRQMAWIPRPCGEIEVSQLGLEERWEAAVTTKVTCRWRRTAGDLIECGMLAGMLSELNAALVSRENTEA